MTALERLTLAVVDDDDDVRTALRRLLQSMGHETRLFASAEAFNADPAPVDCVILDVRLPGSSGLDLRDRMRSSGSRVPVVFITGEAGLFEGDGGRNSGTPWLTKPFEDEALMAAIAGAVAVARSADERHRS